MADAEAFSRTRIDPYVRVDPTTLSPDDHMSRALGALANGRGPAVVVLDDEHRYRGIVTEGEVLRAHGDPASMHVRHILRHDVPTLTRDATLADAASALLSTDMRALAVVDGRGRVDALIAREDVVRAAAEIAFAERPLAHDVTREVATAQAGDTIAQALSLMRRAGFAHLPVMRSDQLAGIVTTHDILRNVLVPLRGPGSEGLRSGPVGRPASVPVETVMTASVETLPSDATYAEAARRMTQRGIGSVLVVDDARRVQGIATRGDLLAPVALAAASVPQIAVQFSSHAVTRASYEGSGAPEVVKGFLDRYARWIEPGILRLHVKRENHQRTGSALWHVRMALTCDAGKFNAVGEGENLPHATRLGVEHLEREVRRVKDAALSHSSRQVKAEMLG